MTAKTGRVGSVAESGTVSGGPGDVPASAAGPPHPRHPYSGRPLWADCTFTAHTAHGTYRCTETSVPVTTSPDSTMAWSQEHWVKVDGEIVPDTAHGTLVPRTMTRTRP